MPHFTEYVERDGNYREELLGLVESYGFAVLCPDDSLESKDYLTGYGFGYYQMFGSHKNILVLCNNERIYGAGLKYLEKFGEKSGYAIISRKDFIKKYSVFRVTEKCLMNDHPVSCHNCLDGMRREGSVRSFKARVDKEG